MPLDRNAKARMAPYAKAWPPDTASRAKARAPRSPGLPGGAGDAAVELPQQPLRLLLPVIRGDRRQGGVRPLYGGRGAEGAGVGRRADLAASLTRIHIRERHGHWASRWRVIRTSNAYVFRDPQPRPRGFLLPSPKIRREHRIQRLLILHWPGGQPGQPIGVGLATAQRCHQRKIAHEQGERAGSGDLTRGSSCQDRSTGGNRAGKLSLIRGAGSQESYRCRRKMYFGGGSSMATPDRSTRITGTARPAAPATCLI